MKYRISMLFLFVTLFSTAPIYAQNWQKVREIIGSEGHIDSDVLGFTFPRSDVDLTVHGIPVSSELAKAWIGFWLLSDGKIQLMGDIAMPANKVHAAQNELLKQGLEINGVNLPYTEALETKPEVAFQMFDNSEVATVEELFLRASEVNKVAHVLHPDYA